MIVKMIIVIVMMIIVEVVTNIQTSTAIVLINTNDKMRSK